MPIKYKALTVSPFFFVTAAVFCHVEGVGVTAVIYLSAALHEAGHFFAARLCRGKITGFSLLPFGIRIELDRSRMSYRGELLTAAAGPAVNLLVWVIFALISPNAGGGVLSFAAAANFLLCAVNLVPALPLDGGAILLAFLLSVTEPEKAHRISDVITLVSLIFLFAAGGIAVAVSGFNLSLLLIACFLLIMLLRNKINNYRLPAVRQ